MKSQDSETDTRECDSRWQHQAIFLPKKNKILTEVLQREKGYKAKKYVEEFLNRNLSLSSLNDLLKKIAQTGTVDHKSSSGFKMCTAQNIDASESWL